MLTEVTLAHLWMSFEPGEGGTGGANIGPIWKKGNPDTELSLNTSE